MVLRYPVPVRILVLASSGPCQWPVPYHTNVNIATTFGFLNSCVHKLLHNQPDSTEESKMTLMTHLLSVPCAYIVHYWLLLVAMQLVICYMGSIV